MALSKITYADKTALQENLTIAVNKLNTNLGDLTVEVVDTWQEAKNDKSYYGLNVCEEGSQRFLQNYTSLEEEV